MAGTVSLMLADKKQGTAAGESDEISRITNSMAGAVAAAQRRPEAGGRPSGRVLWVDDNPDNNNYEREVFEALGFSFELALSTAEALDFLENEHFDAVISDMGRREGPREGYVLLERLRDNGLNLPYFIYSSSNAPEYRREAQARGAQGSTSSPTELLDLVATAVLG
jgi:CheY-like chemotaxis protein